MSRTQMKFALMAFGLASFCQAQIGAPQVGLITDANRSVRPVLGLAGNFLLGESLGEDCLSSASSGSFTLVKTSSSVLVFNRLGETMAALDVEDGPALFAFAADGSPALIFLPGSSALLTFQDGRLERSEVDPDQLGGTVISVAAGGRFLVERADGIWQTDLAGQKFLAGVHAPAILTAREEVFWIDGQTLALRDLAGIERRLDLGFAGGSIQLLGSGWLQVNEQDSARQFAVRTTPEREQVYQLPEGQ